MRLMMGPAIGRTTPWNVAAERQRQHVDLHVVADPPVAPIRIEPPEKAAIGAAGFDDLRRDAAAGGEFRRSANVLHLVLGVVGDGDHHSTNEFEIDALRVAMLLEESRLGDVFLSDPGRRKASTTSRDRRIAHENRAAPFMDRRAVEFNRPPLRFGQRRIALVLWERRFRRGDMLVPGGDRTAVSPAAVADDGWTIVSKTNAPAARLANTHRSAREIVDHAQEHDGDEVGENWRQAERRRQKYRHDRVADERRRAVRQMKAEQADPARFAVNAVAPGPAFVPEKICQDRGLHRHHCGGGRGPTRAPD